MNECVLRAENISYSFDDLLEPILKNVSFSLRQGESLGVLGPNGGGKTTLMKIIAGLLKAKTGEIFFNEKPLSQFSSYPFHLFSYVPQSTDLNMAMPVSVEDFLDFSLSLYKKKVPNLKSVNELLSLVGVEHKKDSLLLRLSGGERQRVLIARAMIQNPKILLLDEPTKGLDSNGQDQLLHLIETIKKNEKTAIMIVDHNINQIIKNCQQILCLNRHFHWHDHKDFLTKNILEDVYHCEFEHLLIHEKDLEKKEHQSHEFCAHTHHEEKSPHPFIRKKS